jgi:uncharacterized protein YndB with AHSA1/START domain
VATAAVFNREIIAEPEIVWRMVTDVDRWPRMLSSLASLDRIEGTGLAPGARWRETRLILGVTAVVEMTVTDVQEGKSFTLAASADDATIGLTYRIKPSSLGTRLEATVNADGAGVGLSKRLRSVVAGGGAKLAREMIERDLADFQAALRT